MPQEPNTYDKILVRLVGRFKARDKLSKWRFIVKINYIAVILQISLFSIWLNRIDHCRYALLNSTQKVL